MKLAAILFTIAMGVSTSATAYANTSPMTYGHFAKEGTAARVIKILPSTRAINVHDGETVRFDVNGKIFEWTINIPTREGIFSFSEIAPTGSGAGTVEVYVSPNPLYLN